MSTPKNTKEFLENLSSIMSGPSALWALRNVFFCDQGLWYDQTTKSFYLTLNPSLILSDNFQQLSSLPKGCTEYKNIYHASAENILPLNSITSISLNEHKLRQMGLGLKFTLQPGQSPKPEIFHALLVQFGCHPSIAEKLTQTFAKDKLLYTTVQYRLKNTLPKMRKELKALGIALEETLPSLNLSTHHSLETKLKQLVKQYK